MKKSKKGLKNLSKEAFRRAQDFLVGGVNSPVRAFRAVGGDPVFIEKGKGSSVKSIDGKTYIDYVGSWGPLILGHSHPAVLKDAEKTLKKGSSFGAPTLLEVELAELIKKAFPSLERIRFVNSGTEACMSALRLARGFTGRSLIIKFSGCYHGHSDGLLVSAGSGAMTFGHPTSSGVPKEIARLTLVLPYNDNDALQKTFNKWGKKIAGVIVEPVAGNMGTVRPTEQFLKTLRRLTKKNESLLIFDEVMTGFRISWGGARKYYGVKPDLTCLGKIVGGGFPVGAFGGSKNIMKKLAPLGPVYQAGTLSGNPVAMAAGLATLRILQKKENYDVLRKRTHDLVNGIWKAARRYDISVRINHIESMFTVFFTDRVVTDYKSAMRCDTKKYGNFFNGLLKRGVYFPPAQFEAAFVSLAHSKSDIEKTIQVVEQVFKTFSQ